jgi:hypothetical protein
MKNIKYYPNIENDLKLPDKYKIGGKNYYIYRCDNGTGNRDHGNIQAVPIKFYGKLYNKI